MKYSFRHTFLMLAMLASSLCAMAESFTKTEGNYRYQGTTGSNEVTLIAYTDNTVTSLTIPETTSEGLKVVAVDFSNAGLSKRFSNLITLNLVGRNLQEIGDRTFSDCPSLRYLNIEKNVPLETIGHLAFAHCPLQNISLPATVTSVGNNAFYGHNSDVVTILNAGLLQRIGETAFVGINNKPSQIHLYDGENKSFGKVDEMFGTNVTSLSFFGGETGYGWGVFPNLQTVNISSSVSSQAFANAPKLANVNFNPAAFDGQIVVDSYAFANCYSLTNVTLKDASLEGSVFHGSKNLREITFDGVKKVSARSLLGLSNLEIYLKNMDGKDWNFAGCDAIVNATIEEGTTSIPYGAFHLCSSLLRVYNMSQITEINAYAFYGCSSLKSTGISSSVTSIGQGAFANCTSLQNPGLLFNVTQIDRLAFSNCPNLKGEVDLTKCTHIGESAFANCTNPELEFDNVMLSACGKKMFEGCSGTISFKGDGAEKDFSPSPASNGSPLNGAYFTKVTVKNATRLGNYLIYNMPFLETLDCRALKEFNVNAIAACPSLTRVTILNSSSLTDDAGVVYNNDHTQLVYAPQGLSKVKVHSACKVVNADFAKCTDINLVSKASYVRNSVQLLDFSAVDHRVTIKANSEADKKYLPAAIKINYGKRDNFSDFAKVASVYGTNAPIGFVTDYIEGDVDEDGHVGIGDITHIIQNALDK